MYVCICVCVSVCMYVCVFVCVGLWPSHDGGLWAKDQVGWREEEQQ